MHNHKQSTLPKLILRTPLEPLTHQVLELVSTNQEIHTLWHMSNVMATERLGINNHGIEHCQLVADIAVDLLDKLHSAGITTSIEQTYGARFEEAQTVVLLASLLHDIGMSINRDGHEEFSVMLAHSIIPQLLTFLSPQPRMYIQTEVLHAIISHRTSGKPQTLEAGVVKLADALDFAHGRLQQKQLAKIDQTDMHVISSAAVDRVIVTQGKKRIIQIDIEMNDEAGMFLVDHFLLKKIRGSGVEHYLCIAVYLKKNDVRTLFKTILPPEIIP